MSDLLGSDIPDENRLNRKGEQQGFTWSDGSLLRAIKEGHWVLLDEINLASLAVMYFREITIDQAWLVVKL